MTEEYASTSAYKTMTTAGTTSGIEDAPELCNPTLRSDVGRAIRTALNDPHHPLSQDDLTQTAAYINQLEDAVLRIHLGLLKESEVLAHLKKCTGLDIESRAYTFATMYSEDA